VTLLRETTFRRFWIGQTVSLVGDQVSLFAIPMTAVLVLSANATQMGLLTAAGLLPSLLFSLAAGAAIDRHGRRRRVMLAADLGRALLMVTIPLSYLLGRLGLPQVRSDVRRGHVGRAVLRRVQRAVRVGGATGSLRRG
jgi:MFS family permease